ncbi:hypothetical protein [Nodularia sp. NIES-3585]|uniref:hypothetical protein n=1 Tax=Nodularia sp. NIES-3585 TaxID=1973477 RepID=UPI000B5C2E8F|nr:hypothetical protein [Nodularia sp. NIES-3585]GAX35335.1 hypothetical protein NIES3585_13480 [Nodularia sp. NIES-3585]
MEPTKNKFHWKYVISWLVMGLVLAICVVTFAKMSPGTNIFAVFVGMLIFPSVYGFLGILFDGWLRHERRFSEIRHSDLIWYIYPVIAMVDITFTIVFGFLWSVVTGKFDKK